MYLPRSLISKLYTHLQSNRHALSQPALLLVALEPDALCACRILTRLLRHDYIPHKIQPVAGYADLDRAARDLVQPMMESRGGGGGVVICLGVGGMVDLGALLGLEPDGGGGSDDAVHYGGVEVWVLDSHRPWNLGNVFGGCPDGPAGASGSRGGRIERGYRPGKGGIVVFDDGDIDDELATEREAYLALSEMPDLDENGADHSGDEEDEQEEEEEEEAERGRASGEEDESREGRQVSARPGQKRKSWSDRDEEQSDGEDDRPRQRRRSNSGSTLASDSPSPARPPQRGLLSVRPRPAADPHEPPSAAQPPSARVLRSRLLRLRRENEAVLRKYYRIGASFSEPISSIVYSLASELGREDNDLLWLAIVGVTSMELYGRSSAGVAAPVRQTATSTADRDSHRPAGWLGLRGARIRQLLRDEVRRLNPPDMALSSAPSAYSSSASALWGVIPTTARSPEDTSIRLSPEPKFLLIRHWSLYDSMLHSPYLFSRLKTWSEPGLRRLHKLLAKMGVSLVQCRQSYAHMDMALKRELRAKLLQYGSLYNLEDMVPGADTDGKDRAGAKDGWGFVRSWGWRATLSAQDVGVVVGALLEVGRHGHAAGDAASSYGGEARDLTDVVDEEAEYRAQGQEWVGRFWDAYDALENVDALKAGLPTAQFLHRAIYRTGTSLIGKKQIRHLRAFRMCVVKDGPDVSLFNHPAALTKLAIWIGEALSEQERESAGRLSRGGRGTPLVVASLNERRGVYVVVGTGGGGGPDTALLDRDAARRRRAKREERARQREENRRNKAKIRDEKRAAKRLAAAGGDGSGGGNGDEDGAGGDAGNGEEEGDELESESDDEDESEEEDDDEDEEVEVEREKGYGLNRFGSAFQEVVAETKARVRIDSFEHSVVEVKKEDLGAFLESLSMKAVVG